MSNANFDNLCKKMDLKDAKDALVAYQTAVKLPNLTEQERAFLERSIPLTRERIERARAAIGNPGC